MTQQKWIVLAVAGSVALMAGAWTFQAMGYAPCKMCYWQRYPHLIAIGLGVLAIFMPARIITLFGALAALTTSGIGFFHAGVEKKWWDGPSSCTGSGQLDGLSGADLISADSANILVMCDEVSWAFLGVSMAAWNGILSLVIAGIWIKAYLSK